MAELTTDEIERKIQFHTALATELLGVFDNVVAGLKLQLQFLDSGELAPLSSNERCFVIENFGIIKTGLAKVETSRCWLLEDVASLLDRLQKELPALKDAYGSHIFNTK